jgi:hypothetical protein
MWLYRLPLVWYKRDEQTTPDSVAALFRAGYPDAHDWLVAHCREWEVLWEEQATMTFSVAIIITLAFHCQREAALFQLFHGEAFSRVDDE